MYDYKDPAGATRAAVVALYIYMGFDLLASVLAVAIPPDPEGGVADIAAIPQFLSLIACFIVVGRWIYRTNANAHSLGQEMSITPGWAVGWYAVPIANLFKPYQAMTETWDASHEAAGLDEQSRTRLLPWWWALWLITNVISSVAARVGGGLEARPDALALYASLVSALLNVPLCLILIRLARRLSDTQRMAASRGAFV